MGISMLKCGRVWGLLSTPLCYIFGYVYIRVGVTKWVDRYLFLVKCWLSYVESLFFTGFQLVIRIWHDFNFIIYEGYMSYMYVSM